MAGVPLPNPIGLAAGYDKDCGMIRPLSNLGFGYIVAGTVVAQPRQGNPRPRIARNPRDGSLVNSLGFPSLGLDVAARRLSTGHAGIPLLASISGLSVEEFSLCHRTLQPLTSGIELNISSPNTEGIRVFQEPQRLRELLSILAPLKEKPLFLKLPPYLDNDRRDRTMRLVDLCMDYAVDGVTASNTRPVEDNRLAVGRGGLSGRPLLPDTLRMVAEIRRHAGDGFVINACGGISSGEDALKALQAGAKHGPTLHRLHLPGAVADEADQPLPAGLPGTGAHPFSGGAPPGSNRLALKARTAHGNPQTRRPMAHGLSCGGKSVPAHPPEPADPLPHWRVS